MPSTSVGPRETAEARGGRAKAVARGVEASAEMLGVRCHTVGARRRRYRREEVRVLFAPQDRMAPGSVNGVRDSTLLASLEARFAYPGSAWRAGLSPRLAFAREMV